MNRHSRRGFTLIEVLVAAVLTGLFALLAHAVFTAAVEGERRARLARLALDRRSNAERFLRAALVSLDVGIEAAGSFEGHPEDLRFSTWQQTADGWFELQRIEIRLEGGRLVAAGPAGVRVMLADSITAVGFDYLLEPGAETRWVGEWMSPVSAPLAVRLRTVRIAGTADTMLYLIKARG